MSVQLTRGDMDEVWRLTGALLMGQQFTTVPEAFHVALAGYVEVATNLRLGVLGDARHRNRMILVKQDEEGGLLVSEPGADHL